MLKKLLFIALCFSLKSNAALEYSKIEHPGCPENAFCQKATGEARQKWLENLDNFTRNKISETKLNENLQNSNGIPVANWAFEEASVLPRIVMWDSPCNQHKKEASRFYISEIFRKNLKMKELGEYKNLYFSKAIGIDQNKKIFTMPIPRGETPLFIENGHYYFLREDEGKYYGLLVSRDGDLKITRIKNIKETPKDAICTKEKVDYFYREAPSPTFYQGYNCKDIWDISSKSYKTMLFGWSCP